MKKIFFLLSLLYCFTAYSQNTWEISKIAKDSCQQRLDDSTAAIQARLNAKADVSHSHTYSSLTGTPSTFAPSAHTHGNADIIDLAYSKLTGVPSTFTPSAHTHAESEITNLVTDLAGKAASSHTHAYSSLTGTPSTFAPSAHTHGNADITDLAYSKLTGVPSTFAPSAHTHAESEITNLVTDLAGKAASSHTHNASDITAGTLASARGGAGTVNGVMVANGSGTVAAAVSGIDFKTINSTSILGSGNIVVSAAAGGSNTQINYNSSGSLAGASKTLIDANGSLQQALDNTQATPATDVLGSFASKVAGKLFSTNKEPGGTVNELQASFARGMIGYWLPAGNATTVPGVLGLTAPTVVGTATARTIATTNVATRKRRLGYVSAATAGALAEARIAAAQFTAGSGTVNDGSGFFYVTRFVPSDAATVSGERFFIGLMNSTAAATNVEPSTLTNCIGIAQLSTDATQFYLVFGGSAAQTAVACGTSVGSPVGLSTNVFELAIYAPSGTANTFYVQLTNVSSGVTFTQTLTGASTVIPQSTTLLAHRAWKTNNATALAVGFDICSIYFENE